MTAACGHPICELIGGACSLATHRSRGCRPNQTAREVAPEVFEEIATLINAIERDGDRTAAVRLATLFRREAMEDRNLLVHARADELDVAPALARLCARRD